jgi:hypothetical protein
MKKTLTTHNDVYSSLAPHIMQAHEDVSDSDNDAARATILTSRAHHADDVKHSMK